MACHVKLDLARWIFNATSPDVLVDRRVNPHFFVFPHTEVMDDMFADDLHCSRSPLVAGDCPSLSECDNEFRFIRSYHTSSPQRWSLLRRQWCRFGCDTVFRSVFSMTHTGTRRFCFPTFMRRIFFAAGLFLDMFEHLFRFFGWTHYGGSWIGTRATA